MKEIKEFTEFINKKRLNGEINAITSLSILDLIEEFEKANTI